MDATPSRLLLSPLNFLRRNAQALGQRPAVVHGERRLNYAELEERCNRLASALRDRGLERHDRVAILAPNTPALLEAHYGVPLAGGVLVAMNTRLGKDEIEHIIKDSGAKILLVDAELKELVDEADVDDFETIVIEDTGEDGRSVRAAAGRRLAGAARELARGRERADLDQLHLGHDREAQGRRLHASGRLSPGCTGVAHGGRARLRLGAPVDAPDVPLQRLVPDLGRDPRPVASTCACARSSRSGSGSCSSPRA